MSLINDALKRVKAAQQQNPPSASVGLEFKPVEPAPRARWGAGLGVPFVLAVMAVFALFFGWRLLRQNDSVSAVTVRAVEPAAHGQARPVDSQEHPGSSDTSTAPSPSLAANGHALNPPSAAPTPVNNGSTPISEPARVHSAATDAVHAVVAVRAPGSTNSEAKRNPETPLAQGPDTNQTALASNGTNTPAMATEPAPPAPPPLKLQGIVFNPKRPSAVINGRTVFIGDRVREMRVVAIGRDTATLAGAERKVVLTMAE